MINICTLCDENYLLKGLAMRQSLIDLNVEYKIFWLCLDLKTAEHLSRLQDPNIALFYLGDLEREDPQLEASKNNPPSRYGSQRDNYIWSLTPYFTHYILDKFIAFGHQLIYVDSDIYFYKSPQVILDVMGNKCMAVHTHRFGPNRKKLDVGWYNVGVVVFANHGVGYNISKRWKRLVMDTTNEYYADYGTCGDQKYLELLVDTAREHVCVFDEHPSISHRAPWCCDEDDRPVIFYHFSHFNYDLQNNTWKDSNHGEWKPANHRHIRPYYEQYFEKIKQVSKLIE